MDLNVITMDVEESGEGRKRRSKQEPEDVSKRSCTTKEDDTVPCNDCYDDIMNGTFDFHLHWLVDDAGAGADVTANVNIDRSKTKTCLGFNLEPKDRKSTILSLTQQLTLTKRLLWPAAEECANLKQQVGINTTPQAEFARARAWANPMEVLGESRGGKGLNHRLFMNRSAIKLANIDAGESNDELTKLHPTPLSPRRPSACPATASMSNAVETFLFVDLCGAPGGFSEYLIKRFQANVMESDRHHVDQFHATTLSPVCMGWGMSLRGTNEHGRGAHWKMEDFHEENISYRICSGADGTGDIYNWENVLSLQKEIQENLQEAGMATQKIHLVVADGGFDQQRDHECQEEIAQKMVLCEIAAALELLQPGQGTLIIKMFGSQTPLTRMALRYLSKHFKEIHAVKPISSRPASLERYIVCKSFWGIPEDWKGGQDWINRVMVGNCVINPEDGQFTKLDQYFDQKDCDMLILNLKACNAILGCLQRKATVLRDHARNFLYTLQDMEEETSDVPIDLYREWFLLNSMM